MEKCIPVLFSMCHWHTLKFFNGLNIYRDGVHGKLGQRAHATTLPLECWSADNFLLIMENVASIW